MANPLASFRSHPSHPNNAATPRPPTPPVSPQATPAMREAAARPDPIAAMAARRELALAMADAPPTTPPPWCVRPEGS